MVKKVPALNTSKHAERMRVLQEELKDSTPCAIMGQLVLQFLAHPLLTRKSKNDSWNNEI